MNHIDEAALFQQIFVIEAIVADLLFGLIEQRIDRAEESRPGQSAPG